MDEKMYSDLAAWWPLLSPPKDYEEEAALYHELFQSKSSTPPQTILELGSGGGCNAAHLKKHYQLTLTDKSAEMLANSQKINPECEHFQGDMRTLRLNRLFDAIFIHDAIDYMLTLDDLRQAIETAYLHCKPNGMIMIVPDCVRETFTPYTSHGGNDGLDRSMRYLEWSFDPDPQDSTYFTDFAFLLRDDTGETRCVHDRHVNGLFSQAEWEQVMRSVGWVEIEMIVSSIEGDGGAHQPIFIGRKASV